MARLSSQNIVAIRKEKTIPAMAAAFGVFRGARVRAPFSSIAMSPYCFSAIDDLKLRLSLQGGFAV